MSGSYTSKQLVELRYPRHGAGGLGLPIAKVEEDLSQGLRDAMKACEAWRCSRTKVTLFEWISSHRRKDLAWSDSNCAGGTHGINFGFRAGLANNPTAIRWDQPSCVSNLIEHAREYAERCIETTCGVGSTKTLASFNGLKSPEYSLGGTCIFTGAFIGMRTTTAHVDRHDVLGSVTFVLPFNDDTRTTLCVDPSNSIRAHVPHTHALDDVSHLPRKQLNSGHYGAGSSAIWGSFSRLPHMSLGVPHAPAHGASAPRTSSRVTAAQRLCLTLYCDARFQKDQHKRLPPEDRRKSKISWLDGKVVIQSPETKFKPVALPVLRLKVVYPRSVKWRLPCTIDAAFILKLQESPGKQFLFPSGARRRTTVNLESRQQETVPYTTPCCGLRSAQPVAKYQSYCVFVAMMNAVFSLPALDTYTEHSTDVLLHMEKDLLNDRLQPVAEQRLGTYFGLQAGAARYFEKLKSHIIVRNVRFKAGEGIAAVLEAGFAPDVVLVVTLAGLHDTRYQRGDTNWAASAVAGLHAQHTITVVGGRILDCVEDMSLPLCLESLRECAGGAEPTVRVAKQLTWAGHTSTTAKRERGQTQETAWTGLDQAHKINADSGGAKRHKRKRRRNWKRAVAAVACEPQGTAAVKEPERKK